MADLVNPWWWLAVVLAFLAGQTLGERRAGEQALAAAAERDARALADAREKESMWQGVVNETVKNHEARLAGMRAGLDADLRRLRGRTDRGAVVPEVARADCAGGTGAELSGADAEFLAREAARGDELRAGLAACYEFVDGVNGE